MRVADRGDFSGLTYWCRPVAFSLTLAALALAAYELSILAVSPCGRQLIASDLTKGYLVGAQRFVDTGSPFAPSQVAGPWELEPHSFIHPPPALVLFVPFLFLPLAMWWAVPLGLTAWCLRKLRPAGR